MAQLGQFWPWWENYGIGNGKKYDHWVNLTESVEANLLAMPGNIRFVWPAKARHDLMNFNYLEHQHRIARCDYNPSFTFYSSDEEKQWRDRELAKMKKAGIEKYILWPLAGSSRTHKIYPHAPSIWEHVLRHYPEWGIVTTGDPTCKALETGFEGRQRMWLCSGKLSFRQVLLLMETANVVIGPETGVMSGAAFYPMPKVALLTHSTVENLTRDWVNTSSMWAPNTHCPGRGLNEAPACHKMLPSFEGCRQNEKTMVAQCSSETQPEWVWEVLQACMNTGVAPKWSPPA
jgi:ADP-heptose:LPS heptosyltransferase